MNQDDLFERLANLYAPTFTGDEALSHLAAIEDLLIKRKNLQDLAKSSTLAAFSSSTVFDCELLAAFRQLRTQQAQIASHGIDLPSVQAGVKTILLDCCNLYENLRQR